MRRSVYTLAVNRCTTANRKVQLLRASLHVHALVTDFPNGDEVIESDSVIDPDSSVIIKESDMGTNLNGLITYMSNNGFPLYS